MSSLLRLSWLSVWNRRYTVGLTVAALAVSVALLLGVEKLRHQARDGFTQTISGTDLIVGARSGPVQLLLYSVFHLGSPTNNVSWESYQKVAEHSLVEWTVPISLGDTHRGYRVMGTSTDLFRHYRYAGDRALNFAQGQAFGDVFEAALGAEVARELGYRVGEKIVLSHGLGRTSFVDHGDKPFTVVGILEPTGTPLDRTVLTGLEGITAIHVDWRQGRQPAPGQRVSAEAARAMDLTPDSVTAFMVGLKSRMATFRVQRAVNDYRGEPLTAILPGVALGELWRVVGVVEQVLLAIAGFVVLAGLLGMVAVLLTSLGERRREMAILRAVGARPWQVFILFLLESLVVGAAACGLGVLLVYGGMALAAATLQGGAALYLSLSPPEAGEWLILGLVLLVVLIAGAIPAWRAYRLSLADGLRMRL